MSDIGTIEPKPQKVYFKYGLFLVTIHNVVLLLLGIKLQIMDEFTEVRITEISQFRVKLLQNLFKASQGN